MAKLELNEDPACERPKDAQKHNDNHAGDEADDGQTGGQREHAIADYLRYH